MNQTGRKARRLLALITLTLALLILIFIFFATQNALEVWERLQTVPKPLFYTYSFFIGLFIAASLWVIYRILTPRDSTASEPEKELGEEELLVQLGQAEESGVDIASLKQEIEELNARKQSGRIYIALFGDVSTGKSSIIKALLPESQVVISTRAGSTREIEQHLWYSQAGDELVLVDLPGRNEAGGELETLIEEEARRAQLVIYVADSDLSRSQFEDVELLLGYNKPTILCINKSDRLSSEDRRLIHEKIGKQLDTSNEAVLAFVQSGGEEEIIRISAEGKEHSEVRPRPAKVDALLRTIQDEIDKQFDELNQLRDASVFVLVKQKLDQSTLAHRQLEGEKIVQSGTRKAVLGALASISPGSDLVIQGIIGTGMIKDLCKLYDVPVRELDIDRFFDFSEGQVRKTLPLILAVAGNAMKAFPGIGTLTGGLTHAFAYGLIFDALGHAVHTTLQQRGDLKPAPAAIRFAEQLNHNMKDRATDIARLVFDQSRKQAE